MHPVDEYAQIKDAIAALEARRDVLRSGFLASGGPRRSNYNEVVVTVRTARVFQKDRLAPDVLADPRLYVMRETRTVCVRPIPAQTIPVGLTTKVADRRPRRLEDDDDIILIE